MPVMLQTLGGESCRSSTLLPPSRHPLNADNTLSLVDTVSSNSDSSEWQVKGKNNSTLSLGENPAAAEYSHLGVVPNLSDGAIERVYNAQVDLNPGLTHFCTYSLPRYSVARRVS